MTEVLSGLACGGLMIGAGIVAWSLPRYPELWRQLPRERVAGIVLGAICLFWAVSAVSLLLEGSLAGLRQWLMPLAIAIAIGSWFYLDYLFTRALGGLLLLLAENVMYKAFVYHVPQRWAIAVACFALGIAGMLIIAGPWRFRDWLRKLTESARHRQVTAILLWIAGGATVVLFLLRPAG